MKSIRPLLLITNDDGIWSPGIKALAEAAYDMADILIVAPESQQTNMGRGALKGDDVGRLHKVSYNLNGQDIPAYSICGSPSQAVAHGVLELLDRLPDYCLSGINYGENLGLAFTCSGTLGAAFEADSFGIPSIAFSRVISFENQRDEVFTELDWTLTKYYAKKILKKVFDKGLPQEAHILNVNFPASMDVRTEIRLTKQANMNCGSYIYPGNRDRSRGYVLGWAKNKKLHLAPQDTDIYAIHMDGVISVTPLTPIMTVNVSDYYGGF